MQNTQQYSCIMEFGRLGWTAKWEKNWPEEIRRLVVVPLLSEVKSQWVCSSCRLMCEHVKSYCFWSDGHERQIPGITIS